MTNKRVERGERRLLIIAELSLLVQEGKVPELTAYGLAKRMGMYVSPPLYSVLNQMVTEGELESRSEYLGARCTRTFYKLAEGTYTLPDKTRVIAMRIGGKIYQEVLF